MRLSPIAIGYGEDDGEDDADDAELSPTNFSIQYICSGRMPPGPISNAQVSSAATVTSPVD